MPALPHLTPPSAPLPVKLDLAFTVKYLPVCAAKRLLNELTVLAVVTALALPYAYWTAW